MTKTYVHIHLPLEKKGRKRNYHSSKSYELCDPCIRKLHEFIKPLEKNESLK